MKSVDFEYGQDFLRADLPDSAEIFIPGETVPDPRYIQDVVRATRESILNPIGMPPISELVDRGSKVTICFPDIVKGGFQETSHRKTCIPLLIDECLKAGVRKEDITLICAIGLHRKNTSEEIHALIGDQIFNEFSLSNQIEVHDAEDWENLVDLGNDEYGDRVIMNKMVFDSDLSILIGHVLGNPYGGYSGGYKMASTGITHWKSIASHHIPEVMHKSDFIPASPYSTMRAKFDAIGQHMEAKMGKKFFMCDAVLDTKARQVAVLSGYAKEMQPKAFAMADQRTFVPWAKEKFDVMMFGMPQKFHYGNGHGTNPILILQAIGANVIRHRKILNDNFIVIAASICNGFFNDQEFASYRELYDLFQRDGHQQLTDLFQHVNEFCSNQKYIDKYRYSNAYHPFHAFSMISCGQIAHIHASAIFLVGAKEPGFARGMEMRPRATFADALQEAQGLVGKNPKILALPKAFTSIAVHLMMENDRERTPVR